MASVVLSCTGKALPSVVQAKIISGMITSMKLWPRNDSSSSAMGPRHCVFRGLEQASL